MTRSEDIQLRVSGGLAHVLCNYWRAVKNHVRLCSISLAQMPLSVISLVLSPHIPRYTLVVVFRSCLKRQDNQRSECYGGGLWDRGLLHEDQETLYMRQVISELPCSSTVEVVLLKAVKANNPENLNCVYFIKTINALAPPKPIKQKVHCAQSRTCYNKTQRYIKPVVSNP